MSMEATVLKPYPHATPRQRPKSLNTPMANRLSKSATTIAAPPFTYALSGI